MPTATRGQFWELATPFLRGLVSPPMLLCYLITATLPFWSTAGAYVFFRSFLIAPSGVFAWVFLTISGAVSIGCITGLFLDAFRRRKAAKLVKLEMPRAALRMIAGFYICIHLIIPAAAALSVWADINHSPGVVKSGDKYRHELPRETLIHTIRMLEGKGIFSSSLQSDND